MCILLVYQYIKVHYVKILFDECITPKHTIVMSEIAINSIM
jgi:hypothetical protein